MHRQNQQIELSLQITISSKRFNLAHLEINIPATTVRVFLVQTNRQKKHAEPANKSRTGGAREGREEVEGEDYLQGGEGRSGAGSGEDERESKKRGSMDGSLLQAGRLVG
jgi:hypothetical protein